MKMRHLFFIYVIIESVSYNFFRIREVCWMRKFLKNDLAILLNHESELCISIFVPTQEVGNEAQQGRIRLKNMLENITHELKQKKYKLEVIDTLLKPAKAFVDDIPFWKHQSEALAIFISPDAFFYYQLPIEVDEVMMINHRFYIKPLVQMMHSIDQAYVVGVSQKGVKLLQWTLYEIEDITPKDFPQNIWDELGYDTPERHLQRNGGSKGIHGHGGIDEHERANLFQFFRKIDQAMKPFVQDNPIPVIFMGVQYLFPIYKEANTHQHLLDKFIEGNPDEFSDDYVHKHINSILSPYKQERMQKAYQKFNAYQGTEKILTELKEIAVASFYKQVDQLFIPKKKMRWGNINITDTEVNIHFEHQQMDEDVYDFAVYHTLKNGGEVFELHTSDMIEAGAIMRY